MIRFLRLLLQYQMRSSPSKLNQKESGMTMIELLVGTIIAFIILTPLMGMVIGLLNDDSREAAKASTEQEIQSALDYISEDVSQALYIYDPSKEITVSGTKKTINEVEQIKTFLPNNTTETPVLVFWKRKLIKDAVPVNSTKQPQECKKATNPIPCDDTYVLSLVSYHLLPETQQNSIWCQPKSTNVNQCPKRIIRYEISDWLKKPDGTTAYTAAELGSDLESYGKDSADNKPYNPAFSLSKPLENVTTIAEITNAKSQVLVNYIEDFKQDDASTNNLAIINIRANALRRIQTDTDCNNKTSPYCLQSSVQVRGLSSLGTSE